MIEKISYPYIQAHTTQLPEAIGWVEKQTHLRTNHPRMLSGSIQGQFLKMMIQAVKPSRILELGTFTGYSALCMAAGMDENCTIDTLELNDELEDLILEGFNRAGMADRIRLHIGDAKQTLMRMKQEGVSFDFAYIDANKREYPEYYDLVLNLLPSGAWMLADNILWDGKLWQDPMPQDAQTMGIAAFNDKAASDPRVECVMLPLRDGLILIRKK